MGARCSKITEMTPTKDVETLPMQGIGMSMSLVVPKDLWKFRHLEQEFKW
jgi:hypothetical protein